VPATGTRWLIKRRANSNCDSAPESFVVQPFTVAAVAPFHGSACALLPIQADKSLPLA